MLLVFFSLLFFVILARFLTIQITGRADGESLAAKAAQLYSREAPIEAKRGTIYDCKGGVLAEDAPSYSLIAVLDKRITSDPKHPEHVTNPRAAARKLSPLIGMNEEDIYRRLTAEGRFQVEFGQAGKDIPQKTKAAIEELKLPGIQFREGSKRFYPNGRFASHLIGFTKAEGSGRSAGQMGIEKEYDKLLKGGPGAVRYEGDRWDYMLPESKNRVDEPQSGKNIHLTIDGTIQSFLEEAMEQVDKEYRPEKMMAVVADPKTGKILAMGQRPTFDPSTRKGIDKGWRNEVVENEYEPGSPMKIFSLAAAVEEGVFHPHAKYKSGSYKVGKIKVKDHNGGEGWGNISYLEGVQRSSNVAFIKMLDAMGMDTYRTYLDKFSFGRKTGIGLPGEASGHIQYKYPIEKVTTVFGQGTSVTALQLVQAMSAIATDGTMMKPYIVEKITDEDGKNAVEYTPRQAGRPISPKTAKQVREVLGTVVSAENGTGKAYDIEGYDVAGKTGTAQISDLDGKGYQSGYNNYLFSFLGMAPKEDPELIMYVAVQKPRLNKDKYESGSQPVSMIFKPVMKNSLQYLRVKPEASKRR